ncbi:MAG TPA: thioredoxin family protein [Candidatus Didemnitutus sp.]|nr:thioredoxin family protein [Candidatus Didemnitutus sp.]
MNSNSFESHPVVSAEKWLAARREFLREEKEFTHARERLAQKRRALPWTKVETNYVFETPNGRASLSDLFGDRDQLIVYHFMLAPGWEEGCRGCSFVSDHFDGALPHVRSRGIAFTAVSLAPLAEIRQFKTRMGWTFPWVSSHGTTFNRDFGVSFTEAEQAEGSRNYNYGSTQAMGEEMPGLSVFARNAAGELFHTYSTYSRGLDSLINAYNLIDLTPRGRDENPEAPMKWVKHHDRYDQAAEVAAR